MIELIGKTPAPLPPYDQPEQVKPENMEPPAALATPPNNSPFFEPHRISGNGARVILPDPALTSCCESGLEKFFPIEQWPKKPFRG